MRRSILGLAVLAVVASACAASPRAVQPNTAAQDVASDSTALLALSEIAVVAPAIIIDVRYATPENFTGTPLPGYGKPVLLLRREAALALARVQRRLEEEGFGLKVWDGYRPVRGTLAMVAWTERAGRTDLLDDGYIARRSRHNQGVAVDLTLVDRSTGAELDMGTPFDEFSARSHTANASGPVAVNRQRLVRAMAAEGFVNYVNEWWHFSFVVKNPVPFDLPLESWQRR